MYDSHLNKLICILKRKYEPCHEKTFCICENKGADQLCINCEADQPFVFATQIVKYLHFLNPN